MATQQYEVRDLKQGSYVMIDEAAVEISSYSTSQPGKHGSAKARIEGKGVFDSKRRSMTQPVDAKARVPIINRKQGQVVSTTGEDVQIMDLETYQTFTMLSPDDTDLTPDDEIEYLEFEDQRKIV